MQPLFPGESGVDQLVEIIKVEVIYFLNLCPSFCLVHSLSFLMLVCSVLDIGYANQRGNQVHESKLHRIQVSPDQSSPMAQGLPESPYGACLYESMYHLRTIQHTTFTAVKLMNFCFLDISQANTIRSSGSCVEAAPVFPKSALHCCKKFELCCPI